MMSRRMIGLRERCNDLQTLRSWSAWKLPPSGLQGRIEEPLHVTSSSPEAKRNARLMSRSAKLDRAERHKADEERLGLFAWHPTELHQIADACHAVDEAEQKPASVIKIEGLELLRA